MIGPKEQLAYADTITKELRQEVTQLQQQLATETAALKEALASEDFACKRADAAVRELARERRLIDAAVDALAASPWVSRQDARRLKQHIATARELAADVPPLPFPAT